MKTEKPYKFTKLQLAWLDALESGEYKKATGALCRFDQKTQKSSYCCLGVACEVYNKTVPKKSRLTVEIDGYEASYDGHNADLPDQVQTALKMIDEMGAYDTSSSLAILNDGANWSHRKIAKFIRKNPRKFFK